MVCAKRRRRDILHLLLLPPHSLLPPTFYCHKIIAHQSSLFKTKKIYNITLHSYNSEYHGAPSVADILSTIQRVQIVNLSEEKTSVIRRSPIFRGGPQLKFPCNILDPYGRGTNTNYRQLSEWVNVILTLYQMIHLT